VKSATKLHCFQQFFCADASVNQNTLECAGGKLFVEWISDRKASGLRLITKANVTTLLFGYFVPEFPQNADEINVPK
jgi:hypothetical protein